MLKKSRAHGFTLVELMIVVAILAILVAIAIPRFGRLIAKSHESTTKGNLGSIRAALSVYYGENDGIYPADDLTSLAFNAKYLPELPGVILPTTHNSTGHGDGYLIGVLMGHVPDGNNDAATQMGWLYDNNASGSDTWGHIIVNCSHSDYAGSLWTSI
jgi:prepilin-type N-terminal cleavage/methylation domain-containing protein